MQARAVGLAALLLGVVALPFGAAVSLSCEEKMLAELGWHDLLPEGQAFDPLPAPLAAAPLALVGGGAPDLHECTGTIQPGARMTSGCTMNFIFRDQLGRLYLGTAGHCTSGVGAAIGISGVGSNVATVVYDGLPGPIDFALARIDPAYYGRVDPTMCHWGGPSAVNTNPTQGQTTHIYGWGYIYGDGAETRARPGVVQARSTNEVTYIGFAQPGDSGSPIVSGDGKAMGVHVRSSLSLGGLRIDPSQKFATRVDRAITLAEQSTGLDLELVTGRQPFNLLGY